jgi:hypothetical protein
LVEIGWWTRSPVQSAPDGGFAVGTAPDGPTSVAAVRLDLGETGVTAASLSAREAGGTLQALAGLRVCFAATPWTAADGGPLADAPAADCSNQAVRLTRADNGAWTADVTPFTNGRTGLIALAVVPEPDASAVPGLPSTYDVQFDTPTLAAAAAPPTPPAAPPPPLALAPAPAEEVAGFFAPLAPPDTPPITDPPALLAGVPRTDDAFAVAPALPPEPGEPSPWRVGVLLPVFLVAALIGATAGLARWSVVSGPIKRLVPERRMPS